MTDSWSLFDDILWPTLIGGVMLLSIMCAVYVGLSVFEFLVKQTEKRNINWKRILTKLWIVFAVLVLSWFIGNRIMVIWDGG